MVVQARERILVDAARAGDLDAFETLVRRHQGAVYRLALRMLGSEADAEDVAQETFVQAWRSLARFRGQSAFGTWLFRIATNRCLNVVAARRVTVTLEEHHIAVGADPNETAQRQARLQALIAAMLELPAEQRAALVLRELEGLSYEEIANVLDISLSAVKGRIHRARLALIARLGEGQ